MTDMEKIKDIFTLKEGERAYFKVETDKDPLSYSLNEDMHFTFTLCDGNENRLSCPKLCYLVRIDGEGEKDLWYTASGKDGRLELSLKPKISGFVYVRLSARDENNSPISFAEECNAGAGANVSEILPSVPEPEDFDEFWQDTVHLLDGVEPEILEFTKLDPEEYGFEPDKYTAYHVRIASVDGEFAAGYLSIPFDAEPNACALRLDFHGYGFDNAFGKYVPKTIVFDVIAHSLPANLSKEELKKISESSPLSHYGMYGDKRNDDRNTVYFRNMILRDLQAARFLVSHFGSEAGEKLWDGKTIGTRGGSQGAFQAAAVGALLPIACGIEPSFLIYNMPWMCDIGGVKHANRYKSGFLPEYNDNLRYYENTSFARRITCRAEGGETGLGDSCALPSATMSFYNSLSSKKKSIRYFQNGVHGGHGKFFSEYLIEN